MNKTSAIFLLLLLNLTVKAQQKVIPLYNGPAPGSESWNWQQQENADNMYHGNVVFNVVNPTLTVYPADSALSATGTAVIICPGGGLLTLSIEQEGYAVARWFQKKGITAFLLKYRLMHTLGTDPYKEMLTKMASGKLLEYQAPVAPLANADGRAAIAYVRAHAAEYGILPSHIGIIGFSAGGTIAATTAYNYTPENRPDFVVPVYAYFPEEMQKNVPTDGPPMFLAAAADDKSSMYSVSLYNTWINSGHSAELHIYSKGGHGFGMKTQGLPSDTWSDRLSDWLNVQGFLTPLSPEKTKAQKDAENFANFQKYFEGLLHTDWAWLTKYQDANAKVSPPAPGEKRVVFMGNSITENWNNADPDFFKANDYISRGIGGQVSSQMLLRFREDVINLKPEAVVIEAGTNDIAQNRGYISLENIFGNIVSMAELAKASGIKPILASVLPATEFSWHPGLEPAEKIVALNAMIKAYAAQNHITYIDYWSALVNDKHGLKVELAQDGLVHPNLAGYKVMEPLAKAAIAKTLK